LLYWYKSTNTDDSLLERLTEHAEEYGGHGIFLLASDGRETNVLRVQVFFPFKNNLWLYLFSDAKVQILTQKLVQKYKY
jgi:hypothetical protein